VNSRRERTAQRNQKRKSVVIIATASVVALIAALCAVAFLFPNRDTTAIERKIPAEASIVFISDPNEASWEYFGALTSMRTPLPPQADKIGFANVKNIPTVYFSIASDENVKKETELFLKDNTIPFINKDNVYAVTAEENRLADEGIIKNADYKKVATKGSNSSFGYINFPLLAPKDIPSETQFIFPSAGIWSGEFKNGQWDGKVSDVDYGNIDQAKTQEIATENIQFGLFEDELDYMKGRNSVKGNFNVSEINSLLDDKFSTAIQKVEFEINGDRLTFTLG